MWLRSSGLGSTGEKQRERNFDSIKKFLIESVRLERDFPQRVMSSSRLVAFKQWEGPSCGQVISLIAKPDLDFPMKPKLPLSAIIKDVSELKPLLKLIKDLGR